MRSLILPAILLAAGLSAGDAPPATVARVLGQVRTLSNPPVGWHISVLDEQNWLREGQLHDVRTTNTTSAFSFVKVKITFVRARYIEEHSDREVRRVLSHEAGHILCQCASEVEADKIGKTLLPRR